MCSPLPLLCVASGIPPSTRFQVWPRWLFSSSFLGVCPLVVVVPSQPGDVWLCLLCAVSPRGPLLLPCTAAQGWEQLLDCGYNLCWRDGSCGMPETGMSPRLSFIFLLITPVPVLRGAAADPAHGCWQHAVSCLYLRLRVELALSDHSSLVSSSSSGPGKPLF